LVVLLLLAFAGVSIFSILHLAGPFGSFWLGVLKNLFGWGIWLFPTFLIFLATIRMRPPVSRPAGVVIFGLLLAILSLSSLFDTLIPLDFDLRRQLVGEGGGYVGLFLRFPLETIFGFWVSVLVLFLLFLASILLIFDLPLARLGHLLIAPVVVARDFFRGLFQASGQKNYREEATHNDAASYQLNRFTMGADEEEETEEESEEKNSQPAAPATLPGLSANRSPRFRPVSIDLPLTLLEESSDKPTSGDINANRDLIKLTLENFGISVEMADISVGPTVTQYTLKPDSGVKLSAITSLSNDLALALAAHPIRIEAPIPGRSLVGIEVPNKAVARVHLREILESEGFQKRTSNLALALGKDVTGLPWVVDLERMPHLLVAGSTGSGKSVALNGVILSLLYQNNPADLKFILVDPKRVEFSIYQHMPHLLTPIITEVPATVNALKWLLGEMDRRFTVLAAAGFRNIQAYNQKSVEKMPYIILVIDELADLMVAAGSEVEAAIIRLAQMSRAVGIHLILATQRPSVDVITGLIKANITARIAFSVASLTDSRTILDSSGAEKLLGRGDLLYVSAEVTKPKRLQGAFIGDDEIREVVNFLKNKATPEYVNEIIEKPGRGLGGFDDASDDPLYPDVEHLVLTSRKASASFLQRRLKVGYARAARLLDILEARGVIGPGDGAKPREVLLALDERDILDSTIPSESDDADETEEF
jgi:S-DNA-T family DNA segregation ATPase FtsK/SpoIIIE